jgi:hypothetical protein
MRRVRCERVNIDMDSKPALAVQTAAPSLRVGQSDHVAIEEKVSLSPSHY